MKYKTIVLFLVSLLLCSCAVLPRVEAQPVVEVSSSKETQYEEIVEENLLYDPDDPSTYVVVAGEKVAWNSDWNVAIEPDSSLDIFDMEFSDFGDFFEEEYPVTVSSYTIAQGTAAETMVWHIHSENEGPTIYISGGIHGDERAAWYAGVLMKDCTISCGDLYVLSQANIIGANKVSRRVEGKEDPNRFFPGNPNGTLTQVLDYAIFSDIQDKNPDLVLDLHEAIVVSKSREFLGSTYIFTTLDGIDMLMFDLLAATEDGDICHNAFSATGPGPAGSLNSTVSNVLGIPVITVETFRGFDIYRRVYDQLDTIQFILEYYGMR